MWVCVKTSRNHKLIRLKSPKCKGPSARKAKQKIDFQQNGRGRTTILNIDTKNKKRMNVYDEIVSP